MSNFNIPGNKKFIEDRNIFVIVSGKSVSKFKDGIRKYNIYFLIMQYVQMVG